MYARINRGHTLNVLFLMCLLIDHFNKLPKFYEQFLDALAKLRKMTVNFVMCVTPRGMMASYLLEEPATPPRLF